MTPKIRVSQAPDSRKPQNFQPKKRFWIKNRIISERSDDGLFSHAFISISKFLTKIDFLGVEGGCNDTLRRYLSCFHLVSLFFSLFLSLSIIVEVRAFSLMNDSSSIFLILSGCSYIYIYQE
jgi:hypothetical protein